MNKLSNKRQCGLDALKFLCACAVVFGHSVFPGDAYVLPPLRSCICIFFMITGYFYSLTVRRGKKAYQIKKIFFLTLFTLILYMFRNMVAAYIRTGLDWDPAFFLKFSLDFVYGFFFRQPQAWVEFLLLNNPPAGEHIWYLSSILYVLLLVALVEKFMDRQRLYVLIPVLWVLNLILGAYAPLLFHRYLSFMYSRNFLLPGLLSFLLGDWLWQNKEHIHISTGWLLFLAISLVAATEIEILFLHSLGSYQDRGFYIATLILAAVVFLLSLKDLKIYQSAPVRLLARWGQRYTLGIYVVNVLVIQLVSELLAPVIIHYPLLHRVYPYLSPFIMLAISFLIAVLAVNLMQLLRRSRQKSAIF